jgi:hypothetical protein
MIFDDLLIYCNGCQDALGEISSLPYDPLRLQTGSNLHGRDRIYDDNPTILMPMRPSEAWYMVGFIVVDHASRDWPGSGGWRFFSLAATLLRTTTATEVQMLAKSLKKSFFLLGSMYI